MARFTNDNVELDPDALSDAEKAQLKRLDEVVRRIEAWQKEFALAQWSRWVSTVLPGGASVVLDLSCGAPILSDPNRQPGC